MLPPPLEVLEEVSLEEGLLTSDEGLLLGEDEEELLEGISLEMELLEGISLEMELLFSEDACEDSEVISEELSEKISLLSSEEFSLVSVSEE